MQQNLGKTKKMKPNTKNNTIKKHTIKIMMMCTCMPIHKELRG